MGRDGIRRGIQRSAPHGPGWRWLARVVLPSSSVIAQIQGSQPEERQATAGETRQAQMQRNPECSLLEAGEAMSLSKCFCDVCVRHKVGFIVHALSRLRIWAASFKEAGSR